MFPQRRTGRKPHVRSDVDPSRLYTFRTQFATTSLPARRRGNGPARLLAWLRLSSTGPSLVGDLVLGELAFRTADVARVLGVSTRTCRRYFEALAKSGRIAILPAGSVGLRVRLLAGSTLDLFKWPRPSTRCIRGKRGKATTPHSYGVQAGRLRRASPESRRIVHAALGRYARGGGRHVLGGARRHALERTLSDVARAEAAGRSFSNLWGFAVARLDAYAMAWGSARTEAAHEQVKREAARSRHVAAPAAPRVSFAAILSAYLNAGWPLARAREAAAVAHQRIEKGWPATGGNPGTPAFADQPPC